MEASEWGESWAAAKYFRWPVAAAKGRSCKSSPVTVAEAQAEEDFWTCVGQALELHCVGESDALQRMLNTCPEVLLGLRLSNGRWRQLAG